MQKRSADRRPRPQMIERLTGLDRQTERFENERSAVAMSDQVIGLLRLLVRHEPTLEEVGGCESTIRGSVQAVPVEDAVRQPHIAARQAIIQCRRKPAVTLPPSSAFVLRLGGSGAVDQQNHFL